MSYRRPDRPDRFGRYDPDPPDIRGRRELLDEPHPGPVGQRLTIAALALVIFALLPAYGLFTVTGRPTAERILARAVPAFTEIDRLIAIHGGELQTQAQATPAGNLSLPGFPIRVVLTAQDVRSRTPEAIQVLLEQRAARVLYDAGPSAFTAPGGSRNSETGPLFSATWTFHKAFSLLNARQHAHFRLYVLLLGILAALLVVGFCLQVGRYGRIVGLGTALLAGSLGAGFVTLFFWFVVQFYSSGAGSPLTATAWGMIADISWTMVLTDAVAALTGTGLLAVGLSFAALARAPAPRPARTPARFAPQIAHRRRRQD
ncbi:MAG: hypothetical protein ACR2PL_18595 [Dehalococcoidia bacterium]